MLQEQTATREQDSPATSCNTYPLFNETRKLMRENSITPTKEYRYLHIPRHQFNIDEIVSTFSKGNSVVLISCFSKAKKFMSNKKITKSLKENQKVWDSGNRILYVRLRGMNKFGTFYKELINYLNEIRLFQFTLIYEKLLHCPPKKNEETIWRKALYGRVKNHILVSNKIRNIPNLFESKLI